MEFHQILYIEARKNYTRLVMADRSIMVLITLKQWEKVLPPQLFCRVHRGYIVSIERILSFDNKYVYLPGMNITIGEQYRNALPMAVLIVASELPKKDILSDIGVGMEGEVTSKSYSNCPMSSDTGHPLLEPACAPEPCDRSPGQLFSPVPGRS